MSDEQPGRAGGGGLPAPGERLSRDALQLPGRSAPHPVRVAGGGALLRRAARRLGGPGRRPARRRRAGRHAAARGRPLGRLSLPLGAGVRRGLRPRARRAGPARAVQLRGAGAPRAARDAARRPPRLLRHRDPARERAAAGRRTRHPGRCSSAGSPAAPARVASPCPARTTRCGTATCTATARSPTATRRRSPPARAPRAASRRSSPSCRTRVRSRAAST